MLHVSICLLGILHTQRDGIHKIKIGKILAVHCDNNMQHLTWAMYV
jgi:hypothetical protein